MTVQLQGKKIQLYHTINNTVWPCCVEVEWNNDYWYTSK